MTDKKVVDFTAARSKQQKQEIDAAKAEVDETKQFIDDFSYTIIVDIVTTMMEFGYDPMEDERTMADIVTCNEAIRGLLSRTKHIKFPMHKISEDIYFQVFGDSDKKEALENFLENLDQYT